MAVSFTKMCGAGNDFLITDWSRLFQKKSPSKKDLTQKEQREINKIIKKIPALCDRRFGLGADGVCLLLPSKKAHLRWRFFNNDGSSAKMCGNATCCIILYAYKKKLISDKKNLLSFEINNQILFGKIKNKKLFSTALFPK